jgi:phosphoribosylformylglycinamidine synthase
MISISSERPLNLLILANVEGGLEVNLDTIAEEDIVKILFAENPGILIQVRNKKEVEKLLEENGVGFARIAKPTDERHILVSKEGVQYHFGIDYMRDVWYESSYKLDVKQSGSTCAGNRFENYKMQPIQYKFHKNFTGKLSSYGISADRRTPSGVKAAIIREKGTNGEREMAYALYLAGFDVKDVHMTDLASGRETLEDCNFIVFCGGFSNSDVLGSAKGWAGGFLYNEKAKKALDNFYARKDTMSLGICNGCQLMAELELLYPEHEVKHKMVHNDSHKFESGFVGLEIPKNNSIMLGSLSGTKLGVWVAHGEGKFQLPKGEKNYNIVAKYTYADYPANPNGSDFSVAGICSADGRHLAMMPHLERAIFPWQWAYYQGVKRKERNEIAMAYLKKVGLDSHSHHLPNELSGGQKQRVAIARALASNPKVLLADEPTGALDTKTSYEVMELIQGINDEGKTILIVTHEPDIAAMCKRNVVLKDGLIIDDKLVEQVRASSYV